MKIHVLPLVFIITLFISTWNSIWYKNSCFATSIYHHLVYLPHTVYLIWIYVLSHVFTTTSYIYYLKHYLIYKYILPLVFTITLFIYRLKHYLIYKYMFCHLYLPFFTTCNFIWYMKIHILPHIFIIALCLYRMKLYLIYKYMFSHLYLSSLCLFTTWSLIWYKNTYVVICIYHRIVSLPHETLFDLEIHVLPFILLSPCHFIT